MKLDLLAMENFLMTNNCTSNETICVPPHFVCGDIFGSSGLISILPAENLAGTLLPATPEFNIPCGASSLQGDLTTHSSYATTTVDCDFKDDEWNYTRINSPCHYSANFGSVASNSNFCSPFTGFTHRNEPSLDPGSDQCSEICGSNITHFTNAPCYNMCKGPLNPYHTSNTVMQQKYLRVMREILFNVASYAVGDLSKTDNRGNQSETKVPSVSTIYREEMQISSCDNVAIFRASTVGQTSPDECDAMKENLEEMLKMVFLWFCLVLSKIPNYSSCYQCTLEVELPKLYKYDIGF